MSIDSINNHQTNSSNNEIKNSQRMRMFDVALEELRKARESAENLGDWSTASKGNNKDEKDQNKIYNSKISKTSIALLLITHVATPENISN